MATIDLRSDTVTQPTPAMRAKMASAEVGDDVYGEDPTVRALERRTAELLGKERAMLVPSGTMANQLAYMLHTRRGDEVVIGEGTHSAWFEAGAAGALSGVQFAVVGRGGLFDAADAEAAIRADAFYLPRTSLVVMENTHNRGGGRVFPLEKMRAVRALADRRGLRVHLDGARLWNASVASGVPLADYAACADSVSVCFSKGLGAPVGSALAGPAALMELALRYRRMLGGSMRQAGILAAGALHAVENHVARLSEDHEKARRFAELVAGTPGVELDLATVETNVVNLRLERAQTDSVIERAKQRGVLIGVIAPQTLRAVFHLDVPSDAIATAAETIARAITEAHALAERLDS